MNGLAWQRYCLPARLIGGNTFGSECNDKFLGKIQLIDFDFHSGKEARA